MKHTKFFLVAAMVCCLATANAQISYCPFATFNMSNLLGGEGQDNEMKPGFNAGLLVNLRAGTNFAFETGLGYCQKGVMSKDDNDLKYEISYLEIPFMPKYIANSGFNFYMGPYIGFLLSSKLTYGSNDSDLKEATNKVDAGMKFGLGYQLENGLSIGANYTYGCTNVFKDEFTDVNYHHSVIGVTVAYLFGGK